MKVEYRKHSLYMTWSNIKTRCYNAKRKDYKWYGGKGIRVCDEWLNPKTFIDWALANGWKKGLEIDRKDSNENYCPKNCRIVTHKKNVENCNLLRCDNSSGYRGVSYHKVTGKWSATISIDSKRKHLGIFDSPILAGIRYDVEAYLTDDRRRNF